MSFNALQYLTEVHNYGGGRFWSKENPKEPASNSELRRWLKAGALRINGKVVDAKTELEDVEITSAVLFPKNNRARITLV